MSIIIKKCVLCDKEFEMDRKDRKCCSYECRKEIRKLRHKGYSKEWIREKRGTLQKWADELLKYGWVVIAPSKKRGNLK